jgi:glycosyltransferase involved in cell wall biosynthesis
MTIIWIDSDLLDNKSGIGRDSKLMVEWLSANFECDVADWPRSRDRKSSYRRKILLSLRLVFGEWVHLPNAFQGALYQSQLGPLIPGREIRVWIVRLHDLFPLTNPEWFRWWATKIFKRSLSLAVSRNAIFLCDSISTENELKKLYVNETLNTFVIPCRLPKEITINCGSCDGCTSLQVVLDNKYFLSVGTVEPRKNYQFAISAWEDFRSNSGSAPNLIIVGRPGWKTQKTQKKLRQARSNGVLWFSNCCDGALERLYSQAEGLISFSLAEGFDLPPMEARQKYQKPLILSDIPVHREFHNDSAMFFSTKSELLEILKNPLRQSTISNYAEFSNSILDRITAYIKSVL